MAAKETVLDWGVCLSRHLQVLATTFPECFPPDRVAELKCDCFYSRLPKCLKAMVAYLKASRQEKTYSDYLQAAREAEKEGSMELSQSQATDNTAKPRTTSFFPFRSSRGPSQQLKHLEEESAIDEEVEGKNPNGIDGVMEEFMVHLARAVKGAQVEEKHCYCSSLGHFIYDCPLGRALRVNSQLNCREGMAPKKGAWAPQMKVNMPKTHQEEVPKA